MAIPITDLMHATAEAATLRERERIIKLLEEHYAEMRKVMFPSSIQQGIRMGIGDAIVLINGDNK